MKKLSAESREIWENIAEWWDEKTKEGDYFHVEMVQPTIMQLLELKQGGQILDIACGNGALARMMAKEGAQVLGIDFSTKFVQRAEMRTQAQDLQEQVKYQVMDVCDSEELAKIPKKKFDAAVCSMALHDMYDITPLAQALRQILKPEGALVFAVPHPCLNGAVTFIEETKNIQGKWVKTQGVKVDRYATAFTEKELGKPNQPQPHYNFYRPLNELLGIFFRAGFVVDRLEEPTLNQDGHLWQEIPPVLVVRMRIMK